MDMSLSKLLETVKDGKTGVLQSMGWQTVTHYLETEQQQMFLSLSFLTYKMRILISTS